MIELLNDLVAVVPAILYFQFPLYPVLGFGENGKTVDGLDASFIGRFIAPEKFIDKQEPVVNADGFPQVADGNFCKGIAQVDPRLF